jgi:hypothetical protein
MLLPGTSRRIQPELNPSTISARPWASGIEWPGLTLVGHGRSRKEPGGNTHLRWMQRFVPPKVRAFRLAIAHDR